MNSHYASGPFKPNATTGQQRKAGVAAVFGDKVWYFVSSGEDRSLALTVLSFKQSFMATQDFTNPRAWSASTLSVNDPGSGVVQVQTNRQPAVAVTSDGLYLFWVASGGGDKVHAAKLDQSGTWSSKIDVVTPKFQDRQITFTNSELKTNCIAAYAYGDTIVLSWVDKRNDGKRVLFSMLLDPASISDDGWTGARISPVLLETLGIDTGDDGITTTWITQGGAANWMAVALFDQGGGGHQTITPVLTSVDTEGVPDGNTSIPLVPFDSIKQGVSLVRGVTGELLAHYVDNNGKAKARTLLNSKKFKGSSIAWTRDEFVLEQPGGSQVESHDIPVFVHVLGAAAPLQNNPRITGRDTYAFIYYTKRRQQAQIPIEVLVTRKGAVVWATETWNLPHALGKDTAPLVLWGVFDAPAPLPGQNLILIQDGGSVTCEMLGHPLGKVEYGKTEGTSQEHTVSNESTVGIQTDGAFTKGVGPAWDVSFSSGVGVASGSSISRVRQSATTGETWIEKSGNVVKATARSLLLGSRPKLTQTCFAFANTDNIVETEPVVVGSQTVKQALIAAQVLQGTAHGGIGSAGFTPFSVTPGDLYSYSHDEVNKAIHAAFGRLDAAAKQAFSGFESYYTGDYVALIRSLAIPMGTDVPYLEVVLDNVGGHATSFEVSTKSFQEWKWTFDASIYAGLSGGFGFDFYGLGEEMSFRIMGGMTVSSNTTARLETTNQWGVSTNLTFPAGAKPGHVTAYTVQVYLLPANPLWAREIMYLSPWREVGVDPNAAPWRIMFLIEPMSLKFVPGDVPGTIVTKESTTANFHYRKIGVNSSANNGGSNHFARYLVHDDVKIFLDGVKTNFKALSPGQNVTLTLDPIGVTQIRASTGSSS